MKSLREICTEWISVTYCKAAEINSPNAIQKKEIDELADKLSDEVVYWKFHTVV